MNKGIIKKGITLVSIAIIVFIALEYQGKIQERLDIDKIQDFVVSFGIWGILVYISIASLRPFFFIPSALMFIIGGVIYGTFMGSLLNIIGLIVGATLCYLVSSRFQFFFSKLVSPKYIDKLDRIKEREAIRTLFIMRVTPAFPFDPISYGAGLTGISYYDFFLGTFLGSFPKVFLYTFIGDGIEDLLSIRTIAVLVILFLFALAPVIIKRYKLA